VQKSLKVGSWIVDPSLNSMSSEGKTVRLEPKVMGVLLCLAEHPAETLSKEQLFQAVWPNIIVTEDVLKRCIAELRRAFDDDARNPHIIETISKRGYRLLVPVSAPAAVSALPESTVTDSLVVLPFTNMSADPENDFGVSPALLLRGSRTARGKRHALRAMVTARDQIDTLRP